MTQNAERAGWRIALALALPFMMAAIQWLFWDDFISPYAWFLFFPTVIVSSMLGGFWTGVISTLESVLIVAFIFMPPSFELWVDHSHNLWSTVLFVVVGVLISAQQARVDRANRTAIESSEAKFQGIVEQAIAGIYIIQDGQFRYVNPHFATMFGFSGPEEIVERIPVVDLIAPEDKERVKTNGEKFATGQLAESHHRLTGLHKDGNEFEFDVHWRTFEHNGRPAAIGLAIDLSEASRAQAEIETLNERLTLATTAAKMGIWDWMIESDEVEWDGQMYLLYGLEPGQPVSYETWRSSLHPDDVTRAEKDTRDALIGARPYDTEFRIVRPDGSIRHIRTLAQIIRDDRGIPVREIGINYDVTPQREAAARERQYAQRLSALTAQLSSAEEVERRRLAENLHDRVSQALAVAKMRLQASHRGQSALGEELVIQSLIEQALAETRAITSELFPQVMTELGLPAALDALCDDLERDSGLECVANVDESLNGLSDELNMVLFRTARELMMNVVKHAEASNAIILLRDTGGWVELVVTDDGRGFDVGEVFMGEVGGFGLFSIRDRIPHLGGTFEVKSSRSDGTRATVRIPIPEPHESE